jgi:hypothetical protein
VARQGDDLGPWRLGQFVDALADDSRYAAEARLLADAGADGAAAEGPADRAGAGEVGLRAKVVGAAECGAASICLLLLEGPEEGRLVDWPRDRLRELAAGEADSARLDQLKAAYSGLLGGYNQMKASLPAYLRSDFE